MLVAILRTIIIIMIRVHSQNLVVEHECFFL